MEVKLLQSDHIKILVKAIRTCWQSEDKSDSFTYLSKDLSEYNEPIYVLGDNDKALIKTIIKRGHTSTLEHSNMTFEITGLPRYILQELVRHRHASYSVESTRYCLRKIKTHEPFFQFSLEGFTSHPDCDKYVYLSGDELLDEKTIRDLDFVRECVASEKWSNDKIKQILPEAFLCNLIFTINCRSMMNFLSLRTDKAAHYLIQELAMKIYEQIPEDHKFIFDGCVKG
jgi:thymidylate synthase (FAD)